MPNISRSPDYNLKVVLKETGLNADVLRAWERRYNLPQPQRTPGGHRLYSEYDIEIVKWLRTRQAEGLSISRAVELWEETIAAGNDPLVEFTPATTSLAPERLSPTEPWIENLRQQWLEANMAFDINRVDEVLNQAFAMFPVETVCTEILQRGISDIGNYWYLDKASIQQEHFASAVANRRLEVLIAATPRPTRQQTVLVGCPPGERHTFSVLMLCLVLCRRGLKVVYLGADVPIDQLDETSAAIQVDLIILGAQQLATAATLQATALTLQSQGIPLAYGGLIFNRVPRLRERIPGYFLGESLEDALHLIERLVVAPTVYSTMINLDETYQGLVRVYQEKRPLIEKALFEELQMADLPTEYVSEANYFFGNGLTAALELGDPAFLEADLEWVKRLLIGRRISSERLIPYLAIYSHALHKEIGRASIPITDWIHSYIARDETAQS
jgi:DNA-binding transcriptional MerR regulator